MSSGFKHDSVVIVSAKRTPIGCFMGSLKNLEAPVLGSSAVRGVINDAGIQPTDVEELFFGNVL
jgi:acetyl-CoA C-acetyltransferase